MPQSAAAERRCDVRSLATQFAWLAGLLGASYAAAGVGAWLTSTSLVNWYPSLAKPSWTPPDWVFGPVWTTLFTMMGVAAWLVWRASGWPAVRVPLVIFAGQLLLNVGWSAIFFALRMPGGAFVEILLLWTAIVCTIYAFWSYSRLAALMLLPYLGWSTFAAALNFAIWRMNA